jgi:hypothetical protein
VLTRTRSALLVAVLGVLALTLVATTLPVTDPADPATGGSGGGGATEGERPPGGATPPAVAASPAVAAAVLVLALVAAAVLLRSGDRTTAMVLGGVTVLAAVAVVAWLFAGGGSTAASGAEPVTGSDPGAGGGGGAGSSPSAAPLVLLGTFLAGVCVVGAAVALGRWRGDPEPEDESEDRDADPAAVGRAAARAAERIRSETPGADNAGYRCWVEVTELADAEAQATYTPAEFATAAVEAGMDEDDVEELRRLFEDVRYGSADPAARESRALSVFERIEAAYAEGGDPE